jgi:hypothetical protein
MNAHALALRALAARYGQTMIYGALRKPLTAPISGPSSLMQIMG